MFLSSPDRLYNSVVITFFRVLPAIDWEGVRQCDTLMKSHRSI